MGRRLIMKESGSKNYLLREYQVKIETQEYDEIFRMLTRKIYIYIVEELGERRNGWAEY